MAFGQELKDFVAGFQTGWKLVADAEKAKDERESRKLDDEYRGLRNKKLSGEIEDEAGARAAFRGAGGGDRDPGPNAKAEGFDTVDDNTPLPGAASDSDVAEMQDILKVARADSGKYGYNALTYGGKQKTADLTNMTLDEIDAFQRKMPSQGHASTALGGYQFVRDTLLGARKALGLSGDTKFTPEVQDRLAAQLVKQRGWDKFKSGEWDEAKFAHRLSREWAILPADASGRGYYDGFNGNKAAVSWDRVTGALRSAKNYQPPATQVATTATPTVPAAAPATPAPTPTTGALPVGTGANSPEEIDRVLSSPDQYAPGTVEWARQMKAKQGSPAVVASFAQGGMVPDIMEEEDAPVTPEVSAVPLGGAAPSPMGGPADQGDRRQMRQSELLDLGSVSEAVDSGLRFIQTQFGFDQGQSAIGQANPRRDEGLRAFAAHAGAADPDEMEAIDRTVDPDGRLSDDQRHIAGFNAVYKYWMDRGEPEKAKRAMGGMLMAQKRAVAMDGTMARAAYENGDIEGMVNAVVQGKNRIPDGESVRATKITPKGVEFEIIDNNGKVKQKSRASIEDVVNLANQMQSGAAWFDQIVRVKDMSPAAKLAQEKDRRAQESAAAATEFDMAGGDTNEFISSLSPEQKAAWGRMSPAEQKSRLQAWQQDRRMNFQRDREEWDRQWGMFQESVKQGRWEMDRERLLDTTEKQLIQRQLEEEGRNNRHGQSQEWRRQRQLELDQQALERRNGARAQAAVPKTVGERRALNIDTAATEAENDVWDRGTSAVNPETGERTTVEGPMMPQYEGQLQGIRVGRGYGLATNGQKPDRERIDADAEQFGAIFDDAWKAEGKTLSAVDRMTLTGAANSIREANPTVTIEEAAMLARTAIDPRANPVVMQDGRVSIHPRLPPVNVSPAAFQQLQEIRRAAGTPDRVVTPSGNPSVKGSALDLGAAGAQAATPGGSAAPVTAPTTTRAYVKSTAEIAAEREEADRRTRYSEQQARNAQEEQQRTNERKETERQKLINQIGQEEYAAMLARAPGGVITLKDLRRAAEEIPIRRQQETYRDRRRVQNRALRGLPID